MTHQGEKKRLSLLLIVGLTFFSLACADEEKPLFRAEESLVAPVLGDAVADIYDNKEKPSIISKDVTGDSLIKWSGDIAHKQTYSFYSALLNKNLPDIQNNIKTTMNVNFDYSTGKKTFGHDAVAVHLTFSHRGYWGADAMKTDKERVDVDGVFFGKHSHTLTRPPLWMKNAWLDGSFDAFGGVVSEGLNRFSVGYFDFVLGRGISLGDSYGASDEFLGVYIKDIDYSLPGFLLYGDLPNERVHYSVYFSQPHAKLDPLGWTRQHIVAQKDFAFTGDYKSDFLLAAQIDFKNDPSWSKSKSFKLSPYGMFYNAPAKKIKIDPDSKFLIGTAGLAFEGKANNFDFGFDAAFNRGIQRVHEIDTNEVKLELSDDGSLIRRYSGIVEKDTGLNAAATKSLKEELAKNLHRDGVVFSVDGKDFVSSSSRIRPGYKVNYKGYMGVADASFKHDNTGVTVSGIVGYASGDNNPHKKTEDKDYNGFFGLHEAYSSKRVPSLVMLGGLNIRRPLALDSEKDGKLKDFAQGTFVDLAFVGGGVKFAPQVLADLDPNLAGNILGFWKVQDGYKIIKPADKNVEGSNATFSANQLASRYLGTEFNLLVSITTYKDFKISLKAAALLPGGYYKDIKGALLDDDVTKILESQDLDNIRPIKARYSMGNDVCYFFSVETSFKF